MTTATVDNKKRIRLPGAEPGQVFILEQEGKTVRLTLVEKPAEPEAPKCKLSKDAEGVLVLDNGRTFTTADVQRALAEEFP